MCKAVRGQCLIVNNEYFDNRNDRRGSDVDATNLDTLFGQLGFQVLLQVFILFSVVDT